MGWSFCVGNNIRDNDGPLQGADIAAYLAAMKANGMKV
jgi:hypothetical protein